MKIKVISLLILSFQLSLFSLSNNEIDEFVNEYITTNSKVISVLRNVQPNNYESSKNIITNIYKDFGISIKRFNLTNDDSKIIHKRILYGQVLFFL